MDVYVPTVKETGQNRGMAFVLVKGKEAAAQVLGKTWMNFSREKMDCALARPKVGAAGSQQERYQRGRNQRS